MTSERSSRCISPLTPSWNKPSPKQDFLIGLSLKIDLKMGSRSLRPYFLPALGPLLPTSNEGNTSIIFIIQVFNQFLSMTLMCCHNFLVTEVGFIQHWQNMFVSQFDCLALATSWIDNKQPFLPRNINVVNTLFQGFFEFNKQLMWEISWCCQRKLAKMWTSNLFLNTKFCICDDANRRNDLPNHESWNLFWNLNV